MFPCKLPWGVYIFWLSLLEQNNSNAPPKDVLKVSQSYKFFVIIAASQQMCNILHKNLKEKTMFKIEEQFKKFETLAEQTKQASEFWFNAVLSSVKEFYKVK